MKTREATRLHPLPSRKHETRGSSGENFPDLHCARHAGKIGRDLVGTERHQQPARRLRIDHEDAIDLAGAAPVHLRLEILEVAVRTAGADATLGGLAYALKNPRLRDLVAKRLPQPGSGPSAEKRERGHWKTRFVAESGSDHLVYTASDRADPGYKSTATMLGESALCLAFDSLSSEGGVTTPSVAMGQRLLDRLRKAGLTFAVAG